MNYMRMNVDEFANLLTDGFVEIEQKLVMLLEERMQVVSIVLKKRTLAIGTLQGIPMHASPLVVVADANVLGEGVLGVGCWVLGVG